jgi:hypothetical protein
MRAYGGGELSELPAWLWAATDERQIKRIESASRAGNQLEIISTRSVIDMWNAVTPLYYTVPVWAKCPHRHNNMRLSIKLMKN